MLIIIPKIVMRPRPKIGLAYSLIRKFRPLPISKLVEAG